MHDKLLRIPHILWIRLIYDLRKRGHGTRESGAFFLGSADGKNKVKKYICYDDLDPHALDTGCVILRSAGFSALWAYCRKYGLQVLGDIHTHPCKIAKQSETDRVNPMISEKGHIALIVPEYARSWSWFMQNVAVYEYMGSYKWCDWSGKIRINRVQLSLW